MAETITIACPECEKQFAVRPEAVGKKVRCKACEHVFVVQAPEVEISAADIEAEEAPPPAPVKKAAPAKQAAPAKKAAAPPPKAPPGKAKAKPALDDDDEDSNPYDVTDVKLGPRCPHCANALESEDSVVCLTCGYNVVTRTKAETRQVEDVTGGRKFLWLLPAFLCVLFSIGLVVFDTIYCFKIENWLGGSKEDWYMNDKLHFALKLWLWIFSLGGIYLMCKYAFIRLVFHPNPPEVEVRMKSRAGAAARAKGRPEKARKKRKKKVEEEDEEDEE